MLTSLRIKNFKAWKDTGQVRLAPLTVIFGANSAGKSSLGHLLLALKQTALSTDRKRALHLGDGNSLIDLGTFADCLHCHDLERALEFEFTWTTPRPLEIKDPLQDHKVYRGDRMRLGVEMVAGKAEQPKVSRIEYLLRDAKGEVLDATFASDGAGKLSLESQHLRLVHSLGRKWPLEEPEKFYRISETSRARFQNADFLADFALETERLLGSICYLGPLRDYPQRTYSWSGETPEDVGPKGEKTVAAFLAAEMEGRTLNRGTRCRVKPFGQFVAEWLVELGIIHGFRVTPVAEGRKEYEVLVKTHRHRNAPEVKITDVGIGVSQVLPAVVLPFYCAPHSIVWMEQPEIHLHPQVQAELADVFITATKATQNGQARGVQLIVESHSEHFLNRLQRRVAEGVISSDDVAVHFCRNASGNTELEPLRLDEYGDIANWPENFFGDEMADLTARTVAAMERRKAQQTAP
jgi:predicted ATPase